MPNTTHIQSEDQILTCITRHFPDYPEHVLLGRGDDCAVIATSGTLYVSTDIFSEHIHFRCTYFTPEDIGFKALAVNLSDLAAHGATPTAFTVSLSVPPAIDIHFLDKLFESMALLARTHNIPLVGGDISHAEALHLCITVMGQAPTILRRGQAKAGDIIFGIGDFGLARAGFMMLEHADNNACKRVPHACQAHLRPKIRLSEGIRLAGLATTLALESGHKPEDILYGKIPADATGRLALMDVSDGLVRDLPRLLNHGKQDVAKLGAMIKLGQAHPDIHTYLNAYEANTTPHDFMATGGDDYALIGTCAPHIAALVMVTIAEAALLGEVTPNNGFTYNDKHLAKGFDHFT